MIYALKAVELVVVLVFLLALSGAWYKHTGGWGGSPLDRIEMSIVGLLSVSTLIHIINLFI